MNGIGEHYSEYEFRAPFFSTNVNSKSVVFGRLPVRPIGVSTEHSLTAYVCYKNLNCSESFLNPLYRPIYLFIKHWIYLELISQNII